MGRGERNSQAIGATDLLYGRPFRGSGPIARETPLTKDITKASMSEYLYFVGDVLSKHQIGDHISLDQRNEISRHSQPSLDIVEHSNNGSSTCRAALLIENDDNYLSVTAGRDNYKDKNNSAATNSFVELEFFHSGDKVLDADDYRSKHWAARLGGDCKGFSDSQSGMIDKITPDLIDAGVTSIRFWADPSVDFAELTKGPGFVNFLGFNKEELPSGRVEPTGYGNADWASQRLIASDMIDFARDKNIIDQEDKELLKNVLNRAIGQQNILLLLGAYTPGYNMMSEMIETWGVRVEVDLTDD